MSTFSSGSVPTNDNIFSVEAQYHHMDEAYRFFMWRGSSSIGQLNQFHLECTFANWLFSQANWSGTPQCKATMWISIFKTSASPLPVACPCVGQIKQTWVTFITALYHYHHRHRHFRYWKRPFLVIWYLTQCQILQIFFLLSRVRAGAHFLHPIRWRNSGNVKRLNANWIRPNFPSDRLSWIWCSQLEWERIRNINACTWKIFLLVANVKSNLRPKKNNRNRENMLGSYFYHPAYSLRTVFHWFRNCDKMLEWPFIHIYIYRHISI